MCDYGNQIILHVPIRGDLSYTGEDRWDDKAIDSCIAPIVKALNDAEVFTLASCCGHGKGGGSIILWDDRELVLRPTDEYQKLRAVIDDVRKVLADDNVGRTYQPLEIIARILEEAP